MRRSVLGIRSRETSEVRSKPESQDFGYREFTVLVVNGSIEDDIGRSIISLSLRNYAALLPAGLVISGAAISAGIVMKSPRLSPEFEWTCLLALFLEATWCVVAWITYFKLTSKALEQLCSLVRWLEELVQGRVVDPPARDGSLDGRSTTP